MAEPRKVFRIEETAAARLPARNDGAPDVLRHTEIIEALNGLRAIMAAPPRQGTKAKGPSGQGSHVEAAHLARVAQELDAVVKGTEQATQKVLVAAEEIDQLANTLSAALKGRIEQDLAQDIQDLVIRIFEACNFQDLIGQRVAKVTATLTAIETSITRVFEEIRNAPPAREVAGQYLHGPRLDNDRGHVTQSEIDAMFGG